MAPYSCWSIFITPYNLPPGMCMKEHNIFFTLVIPRLWYPDRNIDVYLRPLVDELRVLWFDGIHTYDVSKKENFVMKTALIWTISDFPTYGMLSGWNTHGRLACPYCMKNIKSFQLEHRRGVLSTRMLSGGWNTRSSSILHWSRVGCFKNFPTWCPTWGDRSYWVHFQGQTNVTRRRRERW